MSDSVGKISLDIDLQGNVKKQVNAMAGDIGKQFQRSLGGMGGLRMPKKMFQMPKKTMSTKGQQADSEQLSASLDNVNAKIDIQQKKLADLKAEYNGGLSQKVKHQIEQQNQVMQAAEGRIEAQRVKLKGLRESYENAVSPNRKNKLLEDISKTEASIASLTLKSDKALHKIIELESGLNGGKQNQLKEKIVNTEAALLNLGQRSEKLKSQLDPVGDSMLIAGKKADKTEKPVRRLGGAFLFAGKRANGMGNSFSRALTRMLKQVFVFAIIYKALHGLTSYIGSALRTNDQFMHSLNQIKTNLQVAFMPIYNAIVPALNLLMQALATATMYIASFTSALFGSTYKESLKAAQGLNATKGAMDGLGASTKQAAKEAKGLASFDEINSLADSTAGMDGGGAGAGGGVGLVTPDVDTSIIDGKMAGLIAGITSLLQPTIDSLKNLWSAMDPFKNFVAKGAADFYNNFLKPVGTWIFGEGLPRLIDALAVGFQAVNWSKINDGLNGLWKVLTPFAITVGEGLLWFWEKVLVPLGAWTISNVVPAFLDLLSGAIGVLNEVIEVLKPFGTWLYDNFLKPLANWTGGVIVSVLEGIGDGLRVIGDWIRDNHGPVKNMAIVVGSFAASWGLVNAAIITWNTVGVIATGVTRNFGLAVAFATGPIGLATIAIGTFISMGVMLHQNWNNISLGLKMSWLFIKNQAQNIFGTIGKIISNITGNIRNTLSNAWTFSTNFIVSKITDIKNKVSFTFSAIQKYILGAFNGVSTKMSLIWSGIWSAIKFYLNKIIGGFNGMINGMNKLSFNAPSWVPIIGGKNFGVNIPKIPMLAKGGIVDNPTLAMVGEAGKEAVMPLENNTGWISNLAGQIAGQMGGSPNGDRGNQGVIEVLFMILSAIEKLNQGGGPPIWQLDGTTFARLFGPYMKAEEQRIGSSIIKPI